MIGDTSKALILSLFQEKKVINVFQINLKPFLRLHQTSLNLSLPSLKSIIQVFKHPE
jgi:hypothetical protein